MQNTRIYICSHADETHPHALRRSRAQSYRGFRYFVTHTQIHRCVRCKGVSK